MNDREVLMQWRNLFRGQAVTSVTLDEAQGLLDELSLESPLRIRLQNEIEELRVMHS